MFNLIRVVELIEAFIEVDGCCEICPAYKECYQGAECKQVIYNWLKNEGDKK